MGARLYSLEAGRFCAALLVFICHQSIYINYHAAGPHRLIFGGMMFAGPLGVQYFFVLSGFVMIQAHHKDFGRLAAVPDFLWRRACRLYPSYWLALSIVIYYLYAGTSTQMLLHLYLLDPGLIGQYHNQDDIQAAWSLRYEIAFYLMFALCMLPYIGRPLLALWMALCIWRWCGPLDRLIHPQLLLRFNGFALHGGQYFFSFFEYYFFAGLLAGCIFIKYQPGPRAAVLLLAAGLLLCAVMLPGESWGLGFGSPMFMLAMSCTIAAVILGLALAERHGFLRLGRIAGWLGAMSYPIYVFHEPLCVFVDNEFPWRPAGLLGLYAHFALMIALVLGVSAAVTFWVDRPLQRGLRRLTMGRVQCGGPGWSRP